MFAVWNIIRHNKFITVTMTVNSSSCDNRTPSPPFGYSKPCTYTQREQVAIVAEFHAHRIHPARIAYRTGIDIAFIKLLLTGKSHQELFEVQIRQCRKKRHQNRLKDSQIVKPRFRARRLKIEAE